MSCTCLLSAASENCTEANSPNYILSLSSGVLSMLTVLGELFILFLRIRFGYPHSLNEEGAKPRLSNQ